MLTPIVVLVPAAEGDAAAGAARDVVETLRGVVEGDVGVTGAGATVEDYFSAVYDRFP